jgi:hypothetical protein
MTDIHVGVLRAETWQEYKELVAGLAKALTGKESTLPDEWYQQEFAELQAHMRADREGQSETPQEG